MRLKNKKHPLKMQLRKETNPLEKLNIDQQLESIDDFFSKDFLTAETKGE